MVKLGLYRPKSRVRLYPGLGYGILFRGIYVVQSGRLRFIAISQGSGELNEPLSKLLVSPLIAPIAVPI